MPKCYTKERKDKSLYTTCVEGQDKPKKKTEEPKKKKLKIVPKKTEEPKKKKLKIVPKKTEEPKKKKLKIVPKKPKVPTITITEEKKKKLKIVPKKKVDKPEPYKATVKTMKIGKDKPTFEKFWLDWVNAGNDEDYYNEGLPRGTERAHARRDAKKEWKEKYG